MRKIDYHDIIGETFGKWTVLDFSCRKHNMIYYRCKCACGTEKDVSRYNLIRGLSTSCGCTREHTRFRDLTGRTFGKLTVMNLACKRGVYYFYNCMCACGNEVVVRGVSLTKKNGTKSCGCLTTKRRDEYAKVW